MTAQPPSGVIFIRPFNISRFDLWQALPAAPGKVPVPARSLLNESGFPAWMSDVLSGLDSIGKRRSSHLVGRWRILGPTAWQRLGYAFRAVAVREAMQHTGSGSAISTCRRTLDVLALLEAGEDLPHDAWDTGSAVILAKAARRSAPAIAQVAADWAAAKAVRWISKDQRAIGKRARSDAAARMALALVDLLESAVAKAESKAGLPDATLPAPASGPACLVALATWFDFAGVTRGPPAAPSLFAHMESRWSILSPAALHQLDYACRAVAVREAAQHTADTRTLGVCRRALAVLASAGAGAGAGLSPYDWRDVRDAARAAGENAKAARAAAAATRQARRDPGFDPAAPHPVRGAATAAGAIDRVLRSAAASETSAADAAHAAAWAAAWAVPQTWEPHGSPEEYKAASEAHKATAQAAAHQSAARMALEMVGLLEKAVIEAELADVF